MTNTTGDSSYNPLLVKINVTDRPGLSGRTFHVRNNISSEDVAELATALSQSPADDDQEVDNSSNKEHTLRHKIRRIAQDANLEIFQSQFWICSCCPSQATSFSCAWGIRLDDIDDNSIINNIVNSNNMEDGDISNTTTGSIQAVIIDIDAKPQCAKKSCREEMARRVRQHQNLIQSQDGKKPTASATQEQQLQQQQQQEKNSVPLPLSQVLCAGCWNNRCGPSPKWSFSNNNISHTCGTDRVSQKQNRMPSKNNLKPCMGCHSVWYCSRTCQQRIWNAGHAQYCKTLRKNTTRTTPITRF